jgi:hypothetical protein
VGVGEARSRKTNRLSQSAQRAGPTDPLDPTMGLHFVHQCRNVAHLCFDSILPDTRLAENHRFCHAGVCYRSSFPHYTRNSQFLSFLSRRSPTFITLNFFISTANSAHPSRRYGSKKIMASLHLRLATEEKVMVICF